MADKIKTDLKAVTSADSQSSEGPRISDKNKPDEPLQGANGDSQSSTHKNDAPRRVAEEPVFPSDWDQDWDRDIPPPPENYPHDQELRDVVIAAVQEPEAAKELAMMDPVHDPGPVAEPETPQDAQQTVEKDTPVPLVDSTAISPSISTPEPEDKDQAKAAIALPTYIVAPLDHTGGDTVNILTITLRPTGDSVRDNVRIRQIYGTLIAYPGDDRFAFQVFERGKGYLIEFPNFTTGVCSELLARLKLFVSSEHCRVEPIRFQ